VLKLQRQPCIKLLQLHLPSPYPSSACFFSFKTDVCFVVRRKTVQEYDRQKWLSRQWMIQPHKWARKIVDNQKNSCSSTRIMWNRDKSLCFLALHCTAAYHCFFYDGTFHNQGTWAPVCIQNWLQKLHFSSLNRLLIHQCSSTFLYPLQSSTAHHYIYAQMHKSHSNLSLQGIITNAQISLKSHPSRMITQCINLSNSLFREDYHPIHKSHKSHSRIIIRNAQSCLSLFKEHLLPIPMTMPCTRPTTHPRYFAPPRGKRWRGRETLSIHHWKECCKEQKRMYLCCNCGWWGSQNPPRPFWFLGTPSKILARLMALISTERFSSFCFPAWDPPLSNTCIRICIPKSGVQTERSVEETISPPKISVTHDKKRAQVFLSFENCTIFLACSSNPWPGNEGQRLRASGEMGARFRIAVAADDAAVTTLMLSTNHTNCLLLLLE